MSTKKQRKLDKKRKAKRQRDQRAKKKETLAYSGKKYSTEELVPFIFNTERAIYESFVIGRRSCTDHDVRKALEFMIREIRGNRILLEGDTGEDPGRAQAAVGPDEFIVSNILFHWREFFDTQFNPGRDKVVGVLRTILGSIDVWGSIDPKSRGYLEYIEGFLGNLGVECREVTEEELEEYEVLEEARELVFEEPPSADEFVEPTAEAENEERAGSRWGIPRFW